MIDALVAALVALSGGVGFLAGAWWVVAVHHAHVPTKLDVAKMHAELDSLREHRGCVCDARLTPYEFESLKRVQPVRG